ncbi:MAG: hypothetical protein U1E65_04835 [Myxococcota bacterium]
MVALSALCLAACADPGRAEAPAQSSGARAPLGPVGVWYNVSPTAATFVTVAVDPGRPSDVYAVGIGAGVWKSTDYGASFTQKVNTGANAAIFDTGNVSQSLSIATNPANPSGPPILYATADVASINGVLISQDGGANWITTMPGNSELATGAPAFTNDAYSVIVDPTNPNHLLTGFHGNAGISECNNALSANPTWRTVPSVGLTCGGGTCNSSMGQSIYPMFIHPSPTEAAAGATISTTWITQAQWDVGEGMWRTTDSGATWTKVLGLDHAHGESQIYDLGGGLMYAAGYPSNMVAQGVYRSTDYGQTWVNVFGGAPESGVVATASFVYTSNGFAGETGPNLYLAPRSNDTNWSAQTIPAGPPTMHSGFGKIAVTFDGTNAVLVGGTWGGSSSLWRYLEPTSSLDGGVPPAPDAAAPDADAPDLATLDAELPDAAALDAESPDGGAPGPDAGMALDASEAADTGEVGDAGGALDAASPPDAGAPLDAAAADLGTPEDAAIPPDAGAAADATIPGGDGSLDGSIGSSCGCETTSPRGAPIGLLLCLVLAVRRTRR